MPVGGAGGRRRTSSSAGCGSSAAGCRSAWSAGPPSTTPAPATRRHLERARRPLRRAGAEPRPGRPGAAAARRRRRGRRLHARRRARAPRSSCAASTRTTQPGRCPGDRRGGGAASATRSPTGGAGSSQCTYTRPLARDGPALGPGAQAPDLRADRGDRRRPDLQPARGDRRRAQLGLPLHLDPRRRVHALRACCASASPRRRPGSWTGWRPAGRTPTSHGDRPAAAHVRHRRPGRARPRRRSTTWRATAARARCGSATRAHRQLQLDIYGELMDAVYLTTSTSRPSATTPGRTCGGWSTGCATTGSGRTRASGKCAAAGGTSSTRSSCAGWPSTAACGWPTSAPSRPTGRAGSKVRDAIYEEVMAQGLEPERAGVRAGLRLRRPRRLDPADAAGLLHGPERPAHARDPGRDPPARRTRAAWPPTAWSTATIPQARPDGLPGRRGDVQHVHLLAGRGADPRRPHRPGAAGRRPAALRADARLRQPPRASTPSRPAPSGEALGNFPQAFTHLALISAAFNLDRALGGTGRA